MRLLRIRIKNIASLKGEHAIDFHLIESQSSLFAITGETGAGKSTILNCIGLALYGQIYKKNVNQLDVVTLGEKEGQIELIFQVKGKYYLAEWRGKVLKQDGKPYATPQTPSRLLYELDQPEFESTKNITKIQSEELLNLDFDQYCKCVILNQGEFARFLGSSFSERKEILEKLYPGEILENLGKELRSELDAIQKQKFEIEIELGALKSDGFDGESLNLLKNKLKQELELHEAWLKKIEVLEREFISLMSLHARANENKDRIENIKKELSQQTTVYNQLLKTSEEVFEQYEKCLKRQQTELPRLQELLKTEENLLNLETKVAESLERIGAQEKQIQSLNKNLNSVTEIQNQCLLKTASLEKAFTFNIEQLKKQKNELNTIFDLYSDIQILSNDIDSKKILLDQIESSGKNISKELNDKIGLLEQIPEDSKDKLSKLLETKKKAQNELEQIQKNEFLLEEAIKALKENETEYKKIKEEIINFETLMNELSLEQLPILTTLKLEELNSAIETCLEHPIAIEKEECPVCHTKFQKSEWLNLVKGIEKADFSRLKTKSKELERKIIKAQEELKLYQVRETELSIKMKGRNQRIEDIKTLLKDRPLSIESIDQEVSSLQKLIWDYDKLNIEKVKLEEEVKLIRQRYVEIKNEHNKREQILNEKRLNLSKLQKEVSPLLDKIEKEIVDSLKKELQSLTTLIETETELKKVEQEKQFLNTNITNLKTDSDKEKAILKSFEKQKLELKDTLARELGTETATGVIGQIVQGLKMAEDKKNKQEQELKKIELSQKEHQSRLYTIQELSRDIEIQYSKTLQALKLESKLDLPAIKDELTTILDTAGKLALDFNSPLELFIPIEDLIKMEKSELKESTNRLRMEFASTNTKLSAWEKRQDKVSLLVLKNNELEKKLQRLEQLFEVLGKDELRTFILSLVEENLIQQTNEELHKLCQGRYEIVHQSRKMRMTPEFYVLDKYREGGTRKVSTLSGGETFMVSLAMALALAEMTRGSAEIDSLFIDEGFGSLDQDSLEDVLEMLGQIQTRGLTIGIISHIKSLTNALPVNLVLSKRNDGTSSISLQYN